MKSLKTVLTMSILLVTNFTYGQMIPEATKNKFENKYSDASQVTWSILEDKSGYQVSFLHMKKHMHSVFSLNSEWMKTTTTITTKRELPGLVRLTIDELYPEAVYDWMEWFESPSESFFTIAITSGTEEKEEMILTVTSEGEIRSVGRGNKSHRSR